MAEKFLPFDPADALDSDEAIDVFMRDAFQTGDAAFIATALAVIARAQRRPGFQGKVYSNS